MTNVPDRAAPPLWPLHLAAFLATYTFSVSNIAAPVLGDDLHADQAGLSLVMGTFAAVFAAGLIVSGRLGDRFGRRRLFVLGTAGLAMTSLFAALAPTVPLLVAARATQGLAAAVMMPQILATIQASLHSSARVRAVAGFSAASGVGTVAGQVIGGAILALDPWGWSWHAAFGSCAVLALAAAIGGLYLPETVSEDPAGVDAGGALLLAVALLSLVAGLSVGPSVHWSPVPLGLVALAVVTGALFARRQVVRERIGRATILAPSMMRLPPIRTGMVMALVFFGGFGAFLYNYASLTQHGLGLGPFLSGVSLALFALAFVVTSTLAPRATARWGGPATMAGAAAIQGVALVTIGIAAIADVSSWVWWIQMPTVVLGVAQALMFGPLVATVMSAVPDRVAGSTGGLVSTAQQTALGLGVATLGAGFTALIGRVGPEPAFGWMCIAQSGLALVFGACALALGRERA